MPVFSFLRVAPLVLLHPNAWYALACCAVVRYAMLCDDVLCYAMLFYGVIFFGSRVPSGRGRVGSATDEPDRRAEKGLPRGAGANGGSNHARDEETAEHGRLQLPGDHRERGFRRGMILNCTGTRCSLPLRS